MCATAASAHRPCVRAIAPCSLAKWLHNVHKGFDQGARPTMLEHAGIHPQHVYERAEDAGAKLRHRSATDTTTTTKAPTACELASLTELLAMPRQLCSTATRVLNLSVGVHNQQTIFAGEGFQDTWHLNIGFRDKAGQRSRNCHALATGFRSRESPRPSPNGKSRARDGAASSSILRAERTAAGGKLGEGAKYSARKCG